MWLRATSGDGASQVREQLTNGDVVRPVNLETLYLALTEFRTLECCGSTQPSIQLK